MASDKYCVLLSALKYLPMSDVQKNAQTAAHAMILSSTEAGMQR